jgi:hypothetical protein
MTYGRMLYSTTRWAAWHLFSFWTTWLSVRVRLSRPHSRAGNSSTGRARKNGCRLLSISRNYCVGPLGVGYPLLMERRVFESRQKAKVLCSSVVER